MTNPYDLPFTLESQTLPPAPAQAEKARTLFEQLDDLKHLPKKVSNRLRGR